MREFRSGATRNSDTDSLDYEGFLSPLVLERYAQYLHKHRIQADGKVRASDNWQKGIPQDVYMKSAFRHFMAWWKCHRNWFDDETIEEALCALMFNVMGYLHEYLKERREGPTTHLEGEPMEGPLSPAIGDIVVSLDGLETHIVGGLPS